MFASRFVAALALCLAWLPSTLAGTFPIVGPSGTVQPRYEISHMYYNHKDQFNLYMLALAAFQAQDQSSQLSYFGVSGIHGTPNAVWDGVQHTSSGYGYCVHANNLFATWHRPFIALFEQRLVTQAKAIANSFPAGAQRTQYQRAANLLRQPYWDWAARPINGQSTFPSMFTQQTISVISPTGLKTIQNPLFRYTQHPLNSQDYGYPWNQWANTLRYPTSNNANAISQNNLAKSTLDANRPSQCSNVYQFLTNCPTYDSTHEYQNGDPTCGPTLESMHNAVHDWVGCITQGQPYGHMTVIPYSSFDPSFMLHHTQIDHLFALWQALYPNSYTTNQVSQINTNTIVEGQTYGANSFLAPFHSNTAGGQWTSNGVRDWKVFKYTYPEFLGNDGSAASIRAAVNAQYGGSQCQNTAKTSKRQSFKARREESIPDVPTPLVASNGSSFHYSARVKTTRFGQNGSYLISMFLGNPTSEDPNSWVLDPNFVGSYGVFSQAGMTNSQVTTTGTIQLTIGLADRVAQGLLPALDEVYTVPYLVDNLHWRVVQESGVLDPSDIRDFSVSVYVSTLQPAQSITEFPIWSEMIRLPEVTRGKNGGFKPPVIGVSN